MLYKSILNVVGVIMVVIAVMFIGCGGNDDDNDDGGGKGSDIGNYKTVMIGTQRWMAENLDNAIAGSVCYDSLSSNCTKYGRLYTWEAANRACPAGWHLPVDAEWTALTDFVGGRETAGTKLKAASGWNNNGNGTDNYGFSALPGGYGWSDGGFSYAGDRGGWWSATENDAYSAWYRGMSYELEYVGKDNNYKTLMLSVRCVQDN